MQELIKYISDILNIKTESVYTIQDMTDELQKIKDIVAYRSYIKDNIHTIDYSTGYQKFILLTQKYLRLEYKAINPGVEGKAEKIANLAYNIISDGKYNGIAQYYQGEDRKILTSIGSADDLQKLLDSDQLEDMVIKKLMEEEMALPFNQLPDRMYNILKGTTKTIK